MFQQARQWIAWAHNDFVQAPNVANVVKSPPFGQITGMFPVTDLQ